MTPTEHISVAATFRLGFDPRVCVARMVEANLVWFAQPDAVEAGLVKRSANHAERVARLGIIPPQKRTPEQVRAFRAAVTARRRAELHGQDTSMFPPRVRRMKGTTCGHS